MCRLLGSVSRAPVTVDDVLGEERDAFVDRETLGTKVVAVATPLTAIAASR